MSQFQYLELANTGPVSRIRLLVDGPCSVEMITKLSNEWNSVADRADCQTLIIDCSNLRFLSSETLSRMILLQRRLRQKKAKLALLGVNPEVREVLSWTKLDRFFELHDEELAPALT
jgi:anti-anti-sigma factor